MRLLSGEKHALLLQHITWDTKRALGFHEHLHTHAPMHSNTHTYTHMWTDRWTDGLRGHQMDGQTCPYIHTLISFELHQSVATIFLLCPGSADIWSVQHTYTESSWHVVVANLSFFHHLMSSYVHC